MSQGEAVRGNTNVAVKSFITSLLEFCASEEFVNWRKLLGIEEDSVLIQTKRVKFA